MREYSLYIHENKINKKKYIGITCQHPASRRWHNGKGYNKCPFFKNAIEKYGWDNFTHTILYENLTKQEAERLEEELIAKYKSNNKLYGYNIENGGRTRKMSELQKEHLRQLQLGTHLSEEHKNKIRLGVMGKQKCLGYKHSQETKEKHRQLFLGEKNPRSKAVKQYTLDGEYIKTFTCMQDIKKELNISSTCHISDCCRGVRNKCYGYIWKYV